MSNQTKPMTSSHSGYVSLELVRYVKSNQIIPFHVLNSIVMPYVLGQLSYGRADLSSTDGDSPLKLVENIREDMAHIWNASRKLECWERDVNAAIRQLLLQSLDDEYREIMKADPETNDAAVGRVKLNRIQSLVSDLKDKIFDPLRYAFHRDSQSFKLSILSLTRLYGSGGGRDGLIDEVSQMVHLDNFRVIGEQKLLEIEEIYDTLSVEQKDCLLCFSVFPEKEVIKKKVLAHWWIGEGFIRDGDTVTAGDLFKEFADKGLIELVYKKQRQSSDSCKMDPYVRYAVMKIAEKNGFAKFDEDNTRPVANSSDSKRPCLVLSNDNQEPGSSSSEFVRSYVSKQENVKTLFNVSEVELEFDRRWFSKMKNAKVLQLGKWQSSENSKHIVQVDCSDFLEGLKRMKHLRYLSLRGVSRIAELPSSVCKLSSLRILNLNGCNDLQTLPEGIGSLKKLTHLDMNECYFISHMPKGISKLSELQILKGFVIGKPKTGLETKHCQLQDLTKLKKLSKLSINVDRDMSNARTELSCLENMESLESLSVSWSRIYYSSTGPKGMKRVISKVKRTASFLGSPSVGKSSTSTKGSRATPNKLPKKLKKLDLHYFPSEMISAWFLLEGMQGLKKLYVRGGDLINLKMSEETRSWGTVEFLRVKFLGSLKMNWDELTELFPELVYLEMLKCEYLTDFKCDENGIWKKAMTSTEEVVCEKGKFAQRSYDEREDKMLENSGVFVSQVLEEPCVELG